MSARNQPLYVLHKADRLRSACVGNPAARGQAEPQRSQRGQDQARKKGDLPYRCVPVAPVRVRHAGALLWMGCAAQQPIRYSTIMQAVYTVADDHRAWSAPNLCTNL